ncbi:DNA polymerase III subunit gamma/tau [Candidatus Desulfarcum epimagneticum]|uniref:DNA polymerase III subunit gamma/tau n=1 Tax=uncultured Desulfobacteraceae bacterium TaxID=218296 RepID=A0A484HGM5_9BACT|nr:DNA polymerase III subunit gamma/tau [uncultured Desulfobacteraceae bacterium]
MSYLVLARKYRPQTFEEIVEQDHISRTLSNAIASKRLAHAILFSGPRGTGKTSAARILAKAMNCQNGPSPTPCGQCASCRDITDSRALDVFEIDGASNNSVEQIRELRENIKYRPADSPYKIYIIDEVHMLSASAFNALLKTLEEPPPHIIFIFATTEPRKIPATILSRCQRHDFRRIDADALAAHMEKIAGTEGFEIEKESLAVIAREAGGSMRDALSLMDQAFSAAVEKKITHEQLLDILGLFDRKAVFSVSEAAFRHDIPGIVSVIQEIYDKGGEMKRFFDDALEHFRNLILVKMGGKAPALASLADHEIKQARDQVENISLGSLRRSLDILSGEEPSVRASQWPRLSTEIAFFKIAGPGADMDPAPGPRPVEKPGAGPAIQPAVKPTIEIDRLIEKIDALQRRLMDAIEKGAGEKFETRDSNARGKSAAPNPDFKTPGPPPAPEKPGPDAENRGPDPKNAASVAESPAPFPDEKKPPGISANGSLSHSPGQSPGEAWPRLVDRVFETSPYLAAHLEKAELTRLTENSLEIEANGGRFNADTIRRKKNMATLQNICDDFFGAPMAISIQSKKKAPKTLRQARDEGKLLEKEALSHPLVEEALRSFDAKITEIKITREET